MNCKVILNINGIETTSSIMLEDGFDKNDAVIQIKRKLQSILDKDSIKESEKDSLYSIPSGRKMKLFHLNM